MLWNFITFVKGDFVKKILVCLSLFFSFSNVMAQNKVGGGGVSGIRGGIRSGVDGGVSGGGRVFMGMEGGNNIVASILPTRSMKISNKTEVSF